MRDENLKYALIKLKALRSDIDDILSLLAENTGVVSSAESESSVYTDVRESHASGDTEQHQALVEGALEKITETKEVCECRDEWMVHPRINIQQCSRCGKEY